MGKSYKSNNQYSKKFAGTRKNKKVKHRVNNDKRWHELDGNDEMWQRSHQDEA